MYFIWVEANNHPNIKGKVFGESSENVFGDIYDLDLRKNPFELVLFYFNIIAIN